MNRKSVSRTFDTGNPPPLTETEREELDRLAAMDDADIDFGDIPPSDWSRAMPLREALYRPVKQSTTVRIDADVLLWLKSKGKGYQTRLNAILRDAMRADAGKDSSRR